MTFVSISFNPVSEFSSSSSTWIFIRVGISLIIMEVVLNIYPPIRCRNASIQAQQAEL